MLKVEKGYALDDVLLVPKYSEVKSRQDVDLSVDLGKGIKLNIPIISANMKNVTETKMAEVIAELGGLAIFHRFGENTTDNPCDHQISMFKHVVSINEQYKNHVAVSIGIQKNEFENIDKYIDNGVKIICLDIAYANNIHCKPILEYIVQKYPDVLLIAGNVATAAGAKFLVDLGVDIIKANVGSGSICSTRIMTGNGVPTLSCLSNIYDFLKLHVSTGGKPFKIIADGGVKMAGDLTKCLCFSHAVMLGNLLAGTNESPGEIIFHEGKSYKQYAGSSTYKKNNVEGVSGLVPARGPVKEVVQKLMEGLKSGCSYQGVDNLEDLKKAPEFISISGAGLVESYPHDILLK